MHARIEDWPGDSYDAWKRVQKYFPTVQRGVGHNPSRELSDACLEALHTYLFYAINSYRSILQSNRLHLIAPVLIMVGAHFDGDVKILAEENIRGNRLRAFGHVDFVLKRGANRICIVEAKKDDILLGQIKCLLGCESLCDVEDLPVTYGISTNFIEWLFLKNEADVITEELFVVTMVDSRPTSDSLRIIANKIISILD
jgi:hypothetical protein